MHLIHFNVYWHHFTKHTKMVASTSNLVCAKTYSMSKMSAAPSQKILAANYYYSQCLTLLAFIMLIHSLSQTDYFAIRILLMGSLTSFIKLQQSSVSATQWGIQTSFFGPFFKIHLKSYYFSFCSRKVSKYDFQT